MRKDTLTSDLSQKELILFLIKADMKNQKLIKGLDNAGALVEDFYTDLGTIILKLVGFENSDRDDTLFEFYDNKMKGLIDISTDDFLEKQRILALELYNELLIERINRQDKKVA